VENEAEIGEASWRATTRQSCREVLICNQPRSFNTVYFLSQPLKNCSGNTIFKYKICNTFTVVF